MGRGADAAARWLAREAADEDVDAQALKVATAYTNGPFSYFFPGESLPIYFWHEADFAVLYRQDFQRRLPPPRQIAFFEQIAPVYTVQLNGIDYAQVYDLRAGVLPDYVTDWRINAQPVIRLVSYQFPPAWWPGEALPVTLYLLGLAPMPENVSIVLRLVGADGAEIARDEGWLGVAHQHLAAGRCVARWPPVDHSAQYASGHLSAGCGLCGAEPARTYPPRSPAPAPIWVNGSSSITPPLATGATDRPCAMAHRPSLAGRSAWWGWTCRVKGRSMLTGSALS
ncbi:MAG: hypothetical protein R2911_27825 [Caldilineaceae bacterium]